MNKRILLFALLHVLSQCGTSSALEVRVLFPDGKTPVPRTSIHISIKENLPGTVSDYLREDCRENISY